MGETEIQRIGKVKSHTPPHPFSSAAPHPSWTTAQGAQRPGWGPVVSLRTAPALPPVAPSSPHPRAMQPRPLWGGHGEERPPCWPIHLAGGMDDASSRHRLGSPSWGCQPPFPPTPHCPTTVTARFPSSPSFPGASGVWPWSRLQDGGEPWFPPPLARPLHLAFPTLA